MKFTARLCSISIPWICFNLLVFTLTLIITAWSVRHVLVGGTQFSTAQSTIIIATAEFPGKVRDAFIALKSWSDVEPYGLLTKKKGVNQNGWIRHFPEPSDDGYLLLAGLDPVVKHSIVRLIRIMDGKELFRWDPNWDYIDSKISDKKFYEKGSKFNLFANHPLLASNGDIIFNTFNSLIRMDICNRVPLWILDEAMHHSNEFDEYGNIWTPSISNEGFADNPWLHDRVRDDAIALVSPSGNLIRRHSFAKILRENDLEFLLSLGNARTGFDLVHLNQISVARNSSIFWQAGDLLISARSLSTVFLYRPSTNRVIWFKTGPWMAQHSANFVGDHMISVFDNHTFGGTPTRQPFLIPGDNNRVVLFDFVTQLTSEPFKELLRQSRPVTKGQGRARVLPDGGLFVEETNFGRHLRFSTGRLLWSRVNDYNDVYIGAVSWSRYLTANEAITPLGALRDKKCGQ